MITTEKLIPKPISPYGIHKLTFEKYLNYYYQVYGLHYIALRPANVYGPRQYKGGEAGVISIFIDNAVNNLKNIIAGDGMQTRDFVYVDDLIRAFIKACKVNYVGEVNIGTGLEINLLQILNVIESSLEQKIKKEHGPARAGEQLRSCLDHNKAKNILNWKPKISLEKGIKETIKWSKNKR